MNMFWGQESLTLANDPDLALEQILSTWQSWCRRAWAIISCLCSGFRSQVDLSSNPSPSTAQACWLGHHQIAIQVPFLEPLLPPPSSLCSASLSSDSANAKPGERPTLPIKWWSFPKHCSSYISLVDVWACGWSWSYIHTLASGLFGTQTGHSRTLHTPSAREKRSEYFFYTSKHREWLLLNQRESSVNVLCYLCKLPSKKQGLPLLLYTESIIFLEV